MFESMISVPMEEICSRATPFTVAWVPTGMNTGVVTGPCGVWSVPARAYPQDASVTKENPFGEWVPSGASKTGFWELFTEDEFPDVMECDDYGDDNEDGEADLVDGSFDFADFRGFHAPERREERGDEEPAAVQCRKR